MLKPFKQVPSYEPEDKFEITGLEMKAIEDMAKAYSTFIKTMEQMLIRQIIDKKVIIKYFDLDGNEMSEDEIKEMYKEYTQEIAKNNKSSDI